MANGSGLVRFIRFLEPAYGSSKTRIDVTIYGAEHSFGTHMCRCVFDVPHIQNFPPETAKVGI